MGRQRHFSQCHCPWVRRYRDECRVDGGRKQGKEYPGEDPGWEMGGTGRFQGTRLGPGKCNFSIRLGGMPSR